MKSLGSRVSGGGSGFQPVVHFLLKSYICFRQKMGHISLDVVVIHRIDKGLLGLLGECLNAILPSVAKVTIAVRAQG